MNWKWLAVASALLASIDISVSSAADIKLLSPIALRAVIADVTREFEKSSGDKVSVEYATVGVILDRLKRNEPADVAILAGPQLDELQKLGRIVAGSRVDVAQVGVGVFVRTGVPKPDVTSIDAFKRALANAKSISYGDPASGGVSGTHVAGLIERLGLTAEMKPRIRLLPNSQAVLQSVAKGEVDIGFGLTSDTTLVSGVDLVGALPTEIQNFTVYAAAAVAGTTQLEAANAFVSFLRSPATQSVLKSKGFESR
ncbi:molybdate ABC transporter substrate-binding protein [Bradyrhizobium sp. LMTR 3]|uniref:molybdate ABC transporter substrate-binding protein n=1 Tax=Bradyrhizobium sp. LMTR 3 TaxID=189873 RepID=UPI0008106C19|nr:molybdate ABC transporter substrate-binding protein [Bradyrhizobium sp. LMTR 3]OCK62566.1 molybdate ABC transporter substrate-binding protein [Bradyrhizobium sp. LMTR 3]